MYKMNNQLSTRFSVPLSDNIYMFIWGYIVILALVMLKADFQFKLPAVL